MGPAGLECHHERLAGRVLNRVRQLEDPSVQT
jgi:hypothetical protein